MQRLFSLDGGILTGMIQSGYNCVILLVYRTAVMKLTCMAFVEKHIGQRPAAVPIFMAEISKRLENQF